MDNTIVNVALPSISKNLHASLSDLQWTIDAYTLVLARLLILSGSTADRLGRRRTFQTGLAIFTVGSLLCSVAPGLGWLVAFRMLQAVGGSMLNPVAMSIITNVFTDAKERAAAIGVWAGVVGLSIGLGPVVGGVLIGSVGWRGIFWINIPIGLAAIVLTALFVPESKAARARPVDPVGQVLVIATLASLTYAIIEAPRHGWLSGSTLGLLALTLAAGTYFVRYERHRKDPLVEPRFFRSVPFSCATLTAICGFGAFSGFLFLNTLYLQDVRGYSPLVAGLCTLPLAAMALVLGPVAGRIVGARGARIPLAVAGTGLTLGAVMVIGIGAHTSLLWVLASYTVFGCGFAMLNPPITQSAVSGMPRSQAGVAAAVASTSRQVGATLGVAVVGAVLNSGLAGHTGYAVASDAARWAVVVAALAVLALGLVMSSQRAVASAGRSAALFAEEDAALVAP
jgi:EmrB/QacA subfamily drug resistance transporter